MFTLQPDFVFKTFDEVTVDFLKENNINGMILDIDNTLEPYENPVPTEPTLAWFNALAAAGIKVAFVSNNNAKRVELFNQNLKFPAYFKAGKPFKKNVLCALADMDVSTDEAILMGDQVFTDVWAARNAGLRAILVPPIKDKRDIFTRSKRTLEKPIIKKYTKRNNI